MRVSGKHNDLENVGPSLRHHTFFEMLGNFSFGDYFKQDAIALAWTLLTEEWGLDPARLRVTIFKGEDGIPRDDEAYARWRDFVPADHIGELGAADNFWSMGETGPCGRCSEIYVDRGPQVPGTGDFMTDLASGSDRFVEIWNNVFMEFDRERRRRAGAAAGAARSTPAWGSSASPRCCSGIDLELRHGAVHADARRHRRRSPAAATAGRWTPADVSMRVIADHLRAHDLPHRRRRRAIERVARLRAAQDHAARHAPRPQARPRASRSSTRWSTCWSPKWATPIRNWPPAATPSCRSCTAKKIASKPCSRARASPGPNS